VTASQTFTVEEAAELAVIERGGFIESRHAGSAVVLDPDGGVSRSIGNPEAPIFPRSSLKPFQAVAVLTSGVPLAGAAMVLASASHAGTPAHVDVVRSMLAEAGLTESALQCPADWPLDTAARDAVVRDGGHASSITMNCSGKHAAMLLACVKHGWPIDTYLEKTHPLQLQIRDVVERLTGEKIQATATDGCGAPIHAITLAGLARGIHRIATASPGSPFALYRNAAALRSAVLDNGWAIDGPGRANTVVIDELGVFAKGGAEGVMVMAAPNSTTVALKVLDGNLRAASAVALTLLAQAGAIDEAAPQRLSDKLGLTVLGGGLPVGSIRVTV
jgi:L-asparaginase II